VHHVSRQNASSLHMPLPSRLALVATERRAAGRRYVALVRLGERHLAIVITPIIGEKAQRGNRSRSLMLQKKDMQIVRSLLLVVM